MNVYQMLMSIGNVCNLKRVQARSSRKGADMACLSLDEIAKELNTKERINMWLLLFA
jgi:hypothetical protein